VWPVASSNSNKENLYKIAHLTRLSTGTAGLAATIGVNPCSPTILGIGAEPGHHEHLRPSTTLSIVAMGWRSRMRMSSARIVPQPGQ
jgi:hypothetical protein